jgi:glycosyltransferase involved in cell wall biosynthesis
LTPTAEIQRLLRSYDIHGRIEVLPTGIALEGLERADVNFVRRRFNIAPDRRVLLTVGRLAPEKNVPFLLDAFHLVHEMHPNAVLIVVGDGPDKALLEAQVQRLGLEGAVYFAGMVEHGEIVHYYRGAELFVFASVTETQGLVLGESLQAGTPVVAVAAGAVVDALRDVPGSVLCSASPAALGHAICAVMGDAGSLARLRREAESYHGTATPARSVSALLALYEDAIRRRQGLPPLEAPRQPVANATST